MSECFFVIRPFEFFAPARCANGQDKLPRLCQERDRTVLAFRLGLPSRPRFVPDSAGAGRQPKWLVKVGSFSLSRTKH
jgi:hypothetical protein